jgi:hypothetical protein
MQPTISLPKTWEYPMFTLGQYTQNGIIIGIEYYAPDTMLAEMFGQGWIYTVLPDKDSEQLLHILEQDIELMTPEQEQEYLQIEIKKRHRQLAILMQELKAIA